jgi:hypothetical protein
MKTLRSSPFLVLASALQVFILSSCLGVPVVARAAVLFSHFLIEAGLAAGAAAASYDLDFVP